MRPIHLLIILLSVFQSCNGQYVESERRSVGGPCEGCEAVYEHPEMLRNSDTIVGHFDFEQPLILKGIVYDSNGNTPAEGVIIYAYQTNPSGIYDAAEHGTEWSKRHGKHRGWVKTDKEGHFTFYTFVPGSYPKRDEPAHIHLTVLEKGKTPYYIETVLFENDPLLNKEKLMRLRNRGGSGICRIETVDGQSQVQRDIILGLNIPGY